MSKITVLFIALYGVPFYKHIGEVDDDKMDSVSIKSGTFYVGEADEIHPGGIAKTEFTISQLGITIYCPAYEFPFYEEKR